MCVSEGVNERFKEGVRKEIKLVFEGALICLTCHVGMRGLGQM